MNDTGSDIEELILNLVECKQVTCKDRTGRFAFKRLKQMHDLVAFEDKFPDNHFSWLCLGFLEQRWDNSEVYIIPIREWKRVTSDFSKVSINRRECSAYFSAHKANILKGSIIDLEVIKSNVKY